MQKIIMFLIVVFSIVYIMARMVHLLHWIAPMFLEVTILCIVVAVITWLIVGKKK